MKRINLPVILLCILAVFTAQAQKPRHYTSSEIMHELEKLQVLGTVMYVAAHPDDENTRLISFLANERKVQTIYLSVTRGDGGQNLIGPEIREQLGIIRTQELLQARRTDGGYQHFTRANDFGFSKHPDEALSTWDRDKVLADVVWAIRKFRPDVIINRFDTKPGTTHGHHTASAMLALEAFELAADPKAYPEQLKLAEPWQVKRIFWNTYNWANVDTEYEQNPDVISYDVGIYNPLLGKSYTEIAAESRTMHKSQGFGSTGTRGEAKDYVIQLKGDLAKGDIFSGMDISWTRTGANAAIEKKISEIIRGFDHKQPWASLPGLIELRRSIIPLAAKHHQAALKLEALDEIIRASAGLYAEVITSTPSAVPGQGIQLNLEVTNRSGIPIKVTSMAVEAAALKQFGAELSPGGQLNDRIAFDIPATAVVSQPYWLREEGTVGMFEVADQALIGLPENPPAFFAMLHLEILGEKISYNLPFSYKRNDPVNGETYSPFVIIPPAMVALSDGVIVFSDNNSKTVEVSVRAGKDNVSGSVKLDLPKGWTSQPAAYNFDLSLKDESKAFSFTLTPPAGNSDVKMRAIATVDGRSYDVGIKRIDYPHIPLQTLFPKAESRLVKIELQKRGERIGYVQGAGDDIPQSLRQIGYKVDELNPAQLKAENLAGYDAIILGVRAFNTIDELRFTQSELLKYVENGGVMIVQYNTNSRLVTDKPGPYSLRISRERVTEEDAPVRILAPTHPLVNFPNKITSSDFDGWVQERGLYFPDQWDARYTAILGTADSGEAELTGGLLVGTYGKGHYIYTGYAWFRQLPAGVPGAFRLFANMVSLGHYNEQN